MQQRWSLTIENFGKIQHAQMEIRPLLLLVGRNNTGKSYMMSLLWGLVTLGASLFPKDPPTIASYKNCEQWLMDVMREKEDVPMDAEAQQLFVAWYNDVLRQKKKELIRRTFRFDSLEAGTIHLSDYQRTQPLIVKWDTRGARISSGDHYVRLPLNVQKSPSAEEIYRMIRYVTWKLLMDGMSAPFSHVRGSHLLPNWAGECLYLPASRTGFMLVYKSLAQLGIGFVFDDEVIEQRDLYRSRLTFPVERFLQGLIQLSIHPDSASRYHDIAEHIEREILLGEMKQDGSLIKDVLFLPKGGKRDFPLYVTSSVVSELAPLVLFLKSQLKFSSLIFEEPEAHLHPAVQRILARSIVRLVNRGLPVWMTTHSDTIFQQINNLIKLYHHPQREKFAKELNYHKEEYLNPNDVLAYQTQILENGKSTLQKLDLTEYGFAVPTFNESIMELTKETYKLQIEQEENEEAEENREIDPNAEGNH